MTQYYSRIIRSNFVNPRIKIRIMHFLMLCNTCMENNVGVGNMELNFTEEKVHCAGMFYLEY